MATRKKSKMIAKKEWVPMEVTRVPLDASQAVLSCCENVARAGSDETYNCAIGGGECPTVDSEFASS